jgi:hypothetical protein
MPDDALGKPPPLILSVIRQIKIGYSTQDAKVELLNRLEEVIDSGETS